MGESGVYPAGAHICYLYRDDDERRRVVSDLVERARVAGEALAYFPDVPEDGLAAALADVGIAAPASQDAVATAAATYVPQQHFVPDAMLEQLLDIETRARAAGFTGVRVVGEMTWALRGLDGSERLLDYEAKINALLSEHPMTIVCTYDMRRFDGATAFAALRAHPMLVAHGQVIPNPC
jgi:hypothetical protein